MVSWYRKEHPSDTEDKGTVGLSSEDEAEGLGPEAGVDGEARQLAWDNQGGHPHSSGRRRGDSQEVGPQEGEAAHIIPP